MSVKERNNVHVSGLGASTIFFAHGFGCDQNMWRLLAPAYADRYRIVLFDLVGSGLSDEAAFDKTKYASLRGYAADLAEVVREFGHGPAILVSHSVSGMIGVLADNAHPGLFAAHAMVGPSPCYIDDPATGYVGGFRREDIESLLTTLESNYLGWSSTMAPVIMGSPEQPALGVELANSFCRTNPEIAKHFARVTFHADHRADLQLLQTPTLILQSDDDLIAPMDVGRYMQAVMPRATLRIVENVGHCPHLSQPGACAEAIDEFLAANAL
ncbi:alpha/beta hydrolase [Xylophilus sp. GOD-11R]|uniref:alpha/beta fold hydrolase n=1 Tax=Xylophilus sp. GOD-11R TaxID=3089814 RepID=UPI00298D2353|nr:alpha/beta hydrolase [Xylophilus sp. GOD-11R]WPB55416.1 alpha/beta hydrolase [Xylophilus sp. GOD-11R]